MHVERPFWFPRISTISVPVITNQISWRLAPGSYVSQRKSTNENKRAGKEV